MAKATAGAMLAEAIVYVERGWSILPMKPGAKLPAVRWKRYQTARADVRTLRRWFGDGAQHGIGVVFGAVSGDLAARDFDEREAYVRWATGNPDLARTLPTMETHRGCQVFFCAEPRAIDALRQRIGKPRNTGAIPLGDGELRVGIGCYSMLPPSRHPKGSVYRWRVPLPIGPLPLVDPVEAGLAPNLVVQQKCAECAESTEANGANRGTQRVSENTEAIGCARDESPPPENWPEPVQRAILESLPERVGKRHEQVFDLARALKGLAQFRDAPVDALIPYLKRWHEMGVRQRVIGTEPFEESEIDFRRAWPNVRFPKGAEPMAAIFAAACATPAPSCAERYEQPGLRTLVALCRELQRAAGDGPFFLSCRTAGQLLDVDHSTASRWLFLLAAHGIIREEEKGKVETRKASRYRYLLPV